MKKSESTGIVSVSATNRRWKRALTRGPGSSATQKREGERESAAAVLGRPTRAREKRLGPVGPAAKTESRPARVGFHAAGYTGKFFSFVFFSNFPNTFSNQIFLNQSNKTNISTPQNKINATA
jgi:hypothetical protein